MIWGLKEGSRNAGFVLTRAAIHNLAQLLRASSTNLLGSARMDLVSTSSASPGRELDIGLDCKI